MVDHLDPILEEAMVKIPETFQSKIDECREGRLPDLDLSNWHTVSEEEKLTIIPPEIFDFRWLKTLNLGTGRINKISQSLGNLSNLTDLLLIGNQLTSLPESIGNLSNLTSLFLGYNQLTSLPESIGNISNLTRLNLDENQLTSLPESIGNLSNLTRLDLEWNQLTSLPASIGNLSNLTSLFLRYNQLTSLPASIGNLSNLTSLDLSGNQLTSLPASIGNISNLTSLDLSVNQLTSLPASIGNLSNLTTLELGSNPLEEPPIEVALQGIQAIREYFRQKREAGEDTLYEAKLIIVGEGEAGKTTLARRIQNPNCPLPTLDESTEGIDVEEWHFTTDKGKDFRVNIWDFGGQAIYHETHQFFLTHRSLYLLVIDSRKDNPNLSYWLNIVELLSDNSPLIPIKNEKNNYPINISQTQLRGRFENVKDSIRCNFADNRGLEDIVNGIKFYIQKLPHIGITLPKTWIRVRKELEEDKRNYISLNEYLTICNNNGFKQEKDSLQLNQYLHNIGVILHFQDDWRSPLYKTVILKPEWGTEAVYKILRSEKVKQNRGRFTNKDLGEIWKAEEYSGMRGELLDLMMRFKLCYELPNQAQTYIAPQLLDLDPPKEYDPIRDWNTDDNLILRYKYDFMPKGILTRFIVEMHRSIVEPKVWRAGVILERENTLAEVIETYDRNEIRIRLAGANKRGFLEVITDKFDQIHARYHRLKVDKLIPCNCSECNQSQQPYFHRLEVIKKAMGKRRDTIQCQVSFEEVSIKGLIESITPLHKMDRQEAKKTWKQKLWHLEGELAKASDPSQKFAIQEGIKECKIKLREYDNPE